MGVRWGRLGSCSYLLDLVFQGWAMRPYVLLIALLLPPVSFAGANRVPVSKLLDQMIRRSTVAEPGGRPLGQRSLFQSLT